MDKRAKLIAVGMLLLLFLFPLSVISQDAGNLPRSLVTSVDDLIRVLNFIGRILFTILMIAAVGFVLLAAFKYLGAMGDSAKLQEAHRMLFWAVAAVALGLIVAGVPTIVESILLMRRS